ncbi:MAG TPA: arsenate reductase ArsC [Methylococcus sp.]|nr:arsenate reductase ArsC [Methylococcus sp.]
MTDRLYRILVLCTGNSCRSILGEALFNHWGAGRLRACSAGSHPTGYVHPQALATLARHGLPTEGYVSKSWEVFREVSFDLVITVCDDAAGESCPAYLGSAVRGHWGLPDPAKVMGTPEQIEAAFEATFAALKKRVQRLLALPVEGMARSELAEAVRRIGVESPRTG